MPNCDYYLNGGYWGRKCVRLRALREIKPNEDLLVYYNQDAFGEGNRDCLCGSFGCDRLKVDTKPTLETDCSSSLELIVKPNQAREYQTRLQITYLKTTEDVERLLSFYESDARASVSENLAVALETDNFSENQTDLEEMVETAIKMEDIEATTDQSRSLDNDSLYSDNEVLNYLDELESLEVFEIEEQKESEDVSSKTLKDIVFSHVRSVSSSVEPFICHET